MIVRPSDQIAPTGDIAAILQADVPAVVAIVDDGGPGNGGAAGTGFVVSADGVIVTNNHVVEGADEDPGALLRRHEAHARRCSAPRRAATSPCSRSTAPTSRPIELGDSDAVQVGDDVVAIGNALALEGGLSVTRGIVSGLHRDLPDRRRQLRSAT